MFPLVEFLKALDALLSTAVRRYEPGDEQGECPDLAGVLVAGASDEKVYLALDADDHTWRLASSSFSDEPYRVVIEIPQLLTRQLSSLKEDFAEAQMVVNIADLRSQLAQWVGEAYRRKFGVSP